MKASLQMALIATLTMLAGCATTSKYEAKVHSWDGKSASKLVANWGQPDVIEKIHDGDRMFVYARLHREPVAFNEVHRSLASVDAHPHLGNSGGTYIKCATYFKVSPENIIVASFFRGDECKSRN